MSDLKVQFGQVISMEPVDLKITLKVNYGAHFKFNKYAMIPIDDYLKCEANGAEKSIKLALHKQSVNVSALIEDLLREQEEVINSPIRFNGVSVDVIKRVFNKHGVPYREPF